MSRLRYAASAHRYFGSKEELFREVLSHGGEKKFGDTAATLPETFADAVVEHCSEADPDGLERLLIMLRSASSPQASAIVAENIERELMAPLAGLIGGDDARLRATLAMSVMIGSTVLRSILGVTTQSECRPDIMRERLIEMFRAALQSAPEPA
jgi:AcrR family transcriptional regulator